MRGLIIVFSHVHQFMFPNLLNASLRKLAIHNSITILIIVYCLF